MINRLNYEEFFLMYVDNELTAQQRTEVELFMQQNPDLASEMEMLQQAKLLPDEEIFFGNRETLLKSHSSIGIDNYEEFFLNYIDNELKKDEKNEVEKFVLQHPQLQEAFTLLKQTKLEPEAIVFGDKQSLYRREEPRVIPLMLKRFAIAAVLTGVAASLWIMLPKTNNPAEIANVKPIENTDNNITRNDDTLNRVQQLNEVSGEPQIAVVIPEKGAKQKVVEKNTAGKQQPDRVNTAVQSVAVNDNITIAATDQKHTQKEDTPPVDNSLVNTSPNSSLIADNTNTVNDGKKNDVYAFHNTQVVNNTESDYAKPAVYKELNTDEETNSNTIYVGSLGLNKNKVRGIMKKVGGIFSGKSKNAAEEEGKLQVVGFQLNTN